MAVAPKGLLLEITMHMERSDGAGEKKKSTVNEVVGEATSDKAYEVKDKGQLGAGKIARRYARAKDAARKND